LNISFKYRNCPSAAEPQPKKKKQKFTTKDTKGCDVFAFKLRALRDLRVRSNCPVDSASYLGSREILPKPRKIWMIVIRKKKVVPGIVAKVTNAPPFSDLGEPRFENYWMLRVIIFPYRVAPD